MVRHSLGVNWHDDGVNLEVGEEYSIKFEGSDRYRKVKIREHYDGGWYQAWSQKYGHTWSDLRLVHESWQRPKIRRALGYEKRARR